MEEYPFVLLNLPVATNSGCTIGLMITFFGGLSSPDDPELTPPPPSEACVECLRLEDDLAPGGSTE